MRKTFKSETRRRQEQQGLRCFLKFTATPLRNPPSWSFYWVREKPADPFPFAWLIGFQGNSLCVRFPVTFSTKTTWSWESQISGPSLKFHLDKTHFPRTGFEDIRTAEKNGECRCGAEAWGGKGGGPKC